MFFKLYVVPDRTLNVSQISSIGYILLRDEHMNIFKLVLKLDHGSAFGRIYLPDTLQTGVYELVAFTNYMRNYSEKIYFRKQLLIVNRFDKMLDNLYRHDLPIAGTGIPQPVQPGNAVEGAGSLRLNLEKDSFRVREKINIAIDLDPSLKNLKLVNASLSVKAIAQLDGFSFAGSTGTGIPNTGLASSTPPSGDHFLAENKGVYLKGSISAGTVKHNDQECLIISTPDTIPNLEYTYANDSGKFLLLLDNYYLGKKVLIKPFINESPEGSRKIELEDKFALSGPFHPVLPAMNIELKKYIFSSQDMVQIGKAYPGESTVKDLPPVRMTAKIPYVYLHPSSVVLTANYMPLDNFNEISANILYGQVLKKNRDVYNVFLFDDLTKSFFTQPAILFVDGMAIDNASQIINLGSNDIEKISLCNSLRMKGELEIPGVVSITTKKHRPDMVTLNNPATWFSFDKYLAPSTFRSPDYARSGKQGYQPDFRQLLYWEPDLSLRQGVTSRRSFYAGDYVSEYLVELKGFTSDGKPVSVSAKIKIYR